MPAPRLTVLCTLVLSLALPAAGVRAGEVKLDLTLASSALGGDLTYGLYLPTAPAGAALPVVYLLHGFGATHHEWIDLGRIDALLDELIASGRLRPLIAVMPDAGKSWYVDSAARGGPGDFATAIARDLVDHVDASLDTRASEVARAIMGLSMGGFGALVLGFAHPDRFGHIAALSPAVFAKEGLSRDSWSLGSGGSERSRWFPGVFGTPFDERVYDLEQPFGRLDTLSGLASPPRILLTSGDDDSFGFELGTVELFLALRARGLPVELRIDDGAHDWTYWRRAAEEAFLWLDAGWAASEP